MQARKFETQCKTDVNPDPHVNAATPKSQKHEQLTTKDSIETQEQEKTKNSFETYQLKYTTQISCGFLT